MAEDSHDHDIELKQRALRNARNLVNKLEDEHATLGWHKEKQLLLLLGVAGIAVVGFIGLSMMMGGSKEKDLERHRCETDFQVKRVWEYTEKVKAENPTWSTRDMAGPVDKMRPQFKDEAKAACAKQR